MSADRSDNQDSEKTVGDRLMSAFASLIFSVPLAVLFWFLFNRWLYGTDSHVAVWPCVVFVAVLAGVSFLRPKLATDILGSLVNAFFRLGRYW